VERVMMGLAYLRPEVWLRKIERNWQDYGFGAVVRKSLAYALKPLYESRVFRLHKINLLNPTATPSDIEGVSFRFLSSDDATAIQEVEGYSEWLKGTLQSRLESGALCIAAFANGGLAGFNLVSFGQVYIPLIRFRRCFRRNEAWNEQVAVIREFRRQGLGASLRYRTFEELRRRGVSKVYGGALIENLASWQLARRIGCREFADIRYTRILAWRWWRYKKVKK
jgi:RimJ/RimL family protein N-acetyltransferase